MHRLSLSQETKLNLVTSLEFSFNAKTLLNTVKILVLHSSWENHIDVSRNQWWSTVWPWINVRQSSSFSAVNDINFNSKRRLVTFLSGIFFSSVRWLHRLKPKSTDQVKQIKTQKFISASIGWDSPYEKLAFVLDRRKFLSYRLGNRATQSISICDPSIYFWWWEEKRKLSRFNRELR